MTYKEGDIVRLKSGGPLMTVASIVPSAPGIVCAWFDGGQLASASFVTITLWPLPLRTLLSKVKVFNFLRRLGPLGFLNRQTNKH